MTADRRPGTRELLAAGVRAVSRYTGTLLAVFVVQTLLTAACILAIAVLLSQTFAHVPMFDEAVDGDLVALVWCVQFGKASFLAIGCVMFGVLLVWQLASWFLVGGLNGVLAERPDARRETARTFGAAGAATYLKYARLALCQLPGWAIAAVVFIGCASVAGPRMEYALTVPQLLGPLALALVPGLLVLHLLWTVSDYARVELTLRHESHDPGVFFTYLHAFGYVVRHPGTLLHAGLGWLVFAIVTAAYAYLAQGHAMYGAEGAITLYFVRAGVTLLRHAVKVGIMAGQIELGRTRALPRRRAETAR